MEQRKSGPDTRSHRTAMRYFRDHEAMRNLAAREGVAPDDHVGFAGWLIARRPGVVAGAWRRMPASARFGLGLEGADAARHAERMLRGAGSAGAAPVGRGPARIGAPDRQERGLLFRALAAREKNGSRVAGVAADWLRAGRAVGLRPYQWEHARVAPADEVGGPYLRVRKSRQKHGGHASPALRTIDLSGLAAVERTAVLRLVDAIDTAADGFEVLQGSCSQLLRACL